jgi:hypothetical protein
MNATEPGATDMLCDLPTTLWVRNVPDDPLRKNESCASEWECSGALKLSALTIFVMVSEPTATAYSEWAVSSIFVNRSEKRAELNLRAPRGEVFPNFSSGIVKPPETRIYHFELNSQSSAREAQAEHTRLSELCVLLIEKELPIGSRLAAPEELL